MEVLAHGASSSLEMLAVGAYMLLVLFVLIGGIVLGVLTRHDDGARLVAEHATEIDAADRDEPDRSARE